MNLNRRHKAIGFVTVVLTGTSLLAGAELNEALGMLMIGAAFAWAAGSQPVTNLGVKLKSLSGTFLHWFRLPLLLGFCGLVLGFVVVGSRANPVLAVIIMAAAGMLISPLTSIPTQRIWVRVPIVLVSGTAFFCATIIAVLVEPDERFANKFGEVAALGFVSLLVGIWWLSKGWMLVKKGINPAEATSEPPSVATEGAVGPYVALTFGIGLLTLWLSMLAWLGSTNWAYSPLEAAASKANNNLLVQLGFVMLLSSWPYSAWKKILAREPNVDARNLRRHKRAATLAGMFFTSAICIAVTFGIQNGNDRILTDKIRKSSMELKEIATTIGNLKQRDLQTTADYISIYSEIEGFLPAFDAKLQRYEDLLRSAMQRNEARGPINIQRFYKSYRSGVWQNSLAMLDLVRRVYDVTKLESLAVRRMAQLPEDEQPQFWESEFKPLLEQEDALREKILVLQQKMSSSN